MLHDLSKGISSIINNIDDIVSRKKRQIKFYFGHAVNDKRYIEVGNHEMLIYDSYESYISRRLHLDGDDLYRGVVDIIANNIDSGDTVVDIGAHIGYFSLLMADSVGGEGTVVSVEPHPKNFELLRKNMCINGYSERSHNKNIAVSNNTGEVELNLHPTNCGGHSIDVAHSDKCLPVACVTADEILPKGVDFIKIDVEGHEREIIEGMTSKILDESPKILLEYDQKYWSHSDISYLDNILTDHYSFYTVDSDYGLSDKISLNDLNNLGRTNVYCTPL